MAYDQDRIQFFEALSEALKKIPLIERPAYRRSKVERGNLAFFEAYFSNFIEGTEFSIDEAAEIVFKGAIPLERDADAHDLLGTFQIVANDQELCRLSPNFETFLSLLRTRHAGVMNARPDKRPGEFKIRGNRAGNTVFVMPALVVGTLARGFEMLQGLASSFHRAVFMMALISEVHPFEDGNGRTARIMMNAELVSAGQERIIIPIAYQTDYLSALKAFSHNGYCKPLIRMLDVAQRYTCSIDWGTLHAARQMLNETNAFSSRPDARVKFSWPGRM